MGDADLRRLERTWLQSGSAEDGAAYVAALQGVGALSREQVELAAELGFRPARAALGLADPSLDPAEEYRAELNWIERLARFGAPVGRQVARVLADCAVVAEFLAEPFAAFLAALEPCLREPPEEDALQAGEQAAEPLRPRHSSAAVLGGFNPTGTRDDDHVAADICRWEERNGITIQELGAQETLYRFVSALLSLAGKPNPTPRELGHSLPYVFTSAPCSRRDPERDPLRRIPRELVRELGIRDWPEPDAFCYPCPSRGRQERLEREQRQERARLEREQAQARQREQDRERLEREHLEKTFVHQPKRREPLPLRPRPAPGSFRAFFRWLRGSSD